MNEQEREFLTAAREMLLNPDIDMDTICAQYYKVREANPDNAEAEFFAAYLGFKCLLKDNDASCVKAFKAMIACLESAIKCVKESEGDIKEKYMVLCTMVKAYTPITRYIFTKRISTTSSTIESGTLGLYALGTAIKNEFGSEEEIVKLALEPWKEAVSLQRTYYAYKYNGVKPEDYVAEIQKIDPSYTMPDKAGCISLAK